ncbi:MAG TPA: enoyl-CoA hydratase/isomerase family protein [Desulfobacterales bacterium]|mgnify:CR=1 FL=1|jgi:cyclohexa-1,5-dienecarbonyl-CoA hydratase|nr:enoyl-CoA hydratase/isomerase family protein [Desulfobacterales bacterium]HSM90661.1 enoyl-CoA hydratase/isomerase family protein [Desulfobacterales bacterium]
MSDQQFIKTDIAGGVARVTLARPKHNVLNIEMMKELIGELEALKTDRDLKCLVISGEGPSWCAGVEVADHKPGQVDDMIATFNRMLELIEGQEVPTVAAVHGACLGGGMEAAIACDIIVAGQSAVFGQPEIKLGFFPPYAAIRLPQLVGPGKAIEICTTGKRYPAEDALAMGFINYCVEDGRLSETTETLVKEIQYSSPLIIRLNKRAVKQHLGLAFPTALKGVSDLFLNTLMKTADTLEGIASFEEKRKPVWKNQ